MHQLRTLADADRLRSALAGVSSAVVVGMGFIGWEITATHLPWRRGHRRRRRPGLLWTALGPELSAVIRRWHEERGVRILTDQSVTAFRPNLSGSTVAAVELASGERLHAGLVVVGVGARTNTGWLADTPLHLAAGRAIGVDQHRPHHSSRDLGGRRRPRHLGPGQRKPPSARAWASAIEQAQRAARAIAGTPTKPAAAPYLGRE